MISKPGESRLIAEVTRCEQEEAAAAYCLSNPPRSALYDDYNRLAEAVIEAREKLRQARLALKRYRRAENRTGSRSSQPTSAALVVMLLNPFSQFGRWLSEAERSSSSACGHAGLPPEHVYVR